MQERRPDPKPTELGRRKRDLVLDDREPHLVKVSSLLSCFTTFECRCLSASVSCLSHPQVMYRPAHNLLSINSYRSMTCQERKGRSLTCTRTRASGRS
jgi:hypothetical protein